LVAINSPKMDFILPLIIVISIGLVGLGYLIFQLNQNLNELKKSRDAGQDSVIVNLNQRVDDLSRNVGETLQKVTENILQQLNETSRRVDTRLHSSNQDSLKSAQDIRQTINHNIKTIGQVTAKLAQMEESHKRIYDVGRDIAGLQEILRAPKLRGTLGELFLGDLLGQIFPKDRYRLQYTFKGGETVDAILILRDGHTVSIDAKFPLESFKRMLDAQEDHEKKQARKQFTDSVKKRIDEIATKYINPDEGTLDFALMYVPAENVYYETIIKGESDLDITQYAYARKVIPVSPNNLYVYLQTVALGLRGMQIEVRAKEILADLSRLNQDFGKVSESYEVLGKHLSSAVSRYDETNKHLTRFGTRVEQIESKTETETPPVLSGN